MRPRTALCFALATTLTSGCGYALPGWGATRTKAVVARIAADLEPDQLRAAQLAVDAFNRADFPDMKQVRVELVPVVAGAAAPTPGEARHALRALVEDRRVLGLLGPRSEELARTLLPVANRAQLVTVMPGLTDECLTVRAPYCRHGMPVSLRPFHAVNGQPGALTTFRVVTTRTTIGPTAADYAYDGIGRRKVAIVEDLTQAGSVIADSFAKHWSVKGGTVTARLKVAYAGLRDARTLAQQVASTSPDLVLLATADPAGAGRLTKALRPLSPAVVLGTDALLDREYEAAAGPAAEQAVATSLAADAATATPSFLAAYRTRFPTLPPPAPYAAESWLAASVMLQTIRLEIRAATAATRTLSLPERKDMPPAMLGQRYGSEELGSVSFDWNGDTTNQQLTFYVRRDGHWVHRGRLLLGAAG